MTYLRRETSRTSTRKVFGPGITETVTLLKRDDDQRQGVVRALTIYGARRSAIAKGGETIQGDNTVDHRTVWHLPLRRLQEVGVAYISALDRIVQTREGLEKGWTWEPEGTTMIDVKLLGAEIDLACLRTDPTIVKS